MFDPKNVRAFFDFSRMPPETSADVGRSKERREFTTVPLPKVPLLTVDQSDRRAFVMARYPLVGASSSAKYSGFSPYDSPLAVFVTLQGTSMQWNGLEREGRRCRHGTVTARIPEPITAFNAWHGHTKEVSALKFLEYFLDTATIAAHGHLPHGPTVIADVGILVGDPLRPHLSASLDGIGVWPQDAYFPALNERTVIGKGLPIVVEVKSPIFKPYSHVPPAYGIQMLQQLHMLTHSDRSRPAVAYFWVVWQSNEKRAYLRPPPWRTGTYRTVVQAQLMMFHVPYPTIDGYLAILDRAIDAHAHSDPTFFLETPSFSHDPIEQGLVPPVSVLPVAEFWAFEEGGYWESRKGDVGEFCETRLVAYPDAHWVDQSFVTMKRGTNLFEGLEPRVVAETHGGGE